MNILSLIREAVSRAVSANIGGAAIKENSLVMRARQLSPQSLFVAHIAAMALVLIMVLGPSTASARRPPTPENFRVTAVTAYTATVAWDPPRNNSGDFNYHLSGAYGVTSAILPKTATSHTFTRLHSGNEYWFFIYARDAGGNASASVSVTTRTLHDTTPPSRGPVITVTEIGSNYVSISLTPAQDDCPFLSYQYR